MDEKLLKRITKVCDTPAYIFDIKKIKERITFLKSNLPKNILLCYAIKANTFVVKDIEENIDRFEVCSPGEYQICKLKNIDNEKILISGVYKTPEVIEKMIRENILLTYFTIESMDQYELLKKIKTKQDLNLILRLTSGNQFGITEEEIEKIIADSYNYNNINIKGIQYFSGTQKTSIKNLKRELDYIDNYVKRIYTQYGLEIEELEFGPGFPVSYFQNNEYDEESFFKQFSEILEQIEFQGKIILELGRSIVACGGGYITKIVDTKRNKNQNYAIVDGGIHQIVYYGQSMAMKVPKCEIYPKRHNDEETKWNICGSLCTINDILIKQFPISNLKVGDILVFENAGAYCMTEGIALFLSRELPSIIKIKEDKTLEIIRDKIETYKFNM